MQVQMQMRMNQMQMQVQMRPPRGKQVQMQMPHLHLHLQMQVHLSTSLMHITQDKEMSPTWLKHLALFRKELLRIKDQKRGQKYHKQSDYTVTRISSLDY